MDGSRFDQLTRAFAGASSRRGLLRRALGLGSAAVAGGAAAAEADARTLRTRNTITTRPPIPTTPPPPPTTSPPDLCPNLPKCAIDGCCEGTCTAQGRCCADGRSVCGYDCCTTPEQCCDGECCADGTICIGEERCCPPALYCGGVCCNGPGQQCCGDICLQPGQCCGDSDCSGSPETCQTSVCDLDSHACVLRDPCFETPATPCCSNGACVQEGTTEHCGFCGDACQAGQECCAGVCESLDTTAHCGSCDVSCSSGQGCCAGVCESLDTSAHCGSCDVSCSSSETCSAGACRTTTTTTSTAPTTTSIAPTSTSTTTTESAPNTPVGMSIQVSEGGGTLTFASVTTAGTTTITQLPGVPDPPPDSSLYSTDGSQVYDISTTATFSGIVQICLPSTDSADRLLHYVSGTWIDVTDAGYPMGGVVCGTVSSFSRIAIFRAIGSPSQTTQPPTTQPPPTTTSTTQTTTSTTTSSTPPPTTTSTTQTTTSTTTSSTPPPTTQPPTSTTPPPECIGGGNCADGLVCCEGSCQECCGSDASTCSDDKCFTYTCDQGACVLQSQTVCIDPVPGAGCTTITGCNPDTGECFPPVPRDDGEQCGGIGSDQVCCNGVCSDCCGVNVAGCSANKCDHYICLNGGCSHTFSNICGGSNPCIDYGVCDPNTGVCPTETDRHGKTCQTATSEDGYCCHDVCVPGDPECCDVSDCASQLANSCQNHQCICSEEDRGCITPCESCNASGHCVSQCDAGAVCCGVAGAGICCESGNLCCNDVCTPQSTANCGSCGVTCSTDDCQACVDGSCQSLCDAETQECNAGTCECVSGLHDCGNGVCAACCDTSHCAGGQTCSGNHCCLPSTFGTPMVHGQSCPEGSFEFTDACFFPVDCTSHADCCSNNCGELPGYASNVCIDSLVGTTPPPGPNACGVDSDCAICQVCHGSGVCINVLANNDPKYDCGFLRACNGSGTCVPVADGTDPYDECDDPCYVTDGEGGCRPSDAGSDPKQDCTGCLACDGNGGCTPNHNLCPDDGNECTVAVCQVDGTCAYPWTANETRCNFSQEVSGYCFSGECRQCSTATDCGGAGTACCNGFCIVTGPSVTCCGGVAACHPLDCVTSGQYDGNCRFECGGEFCYRPEQTCVNGVCVTANPPTTAPPSTPPPITPTTGSGSGGDIGSSCFVGDALVTMADGSTKPIEQIVAGDVVLGGDGQPSQVLRVFMPRLGHQPLYAINGSKHFVTGSHPLASGKGAFTINEILGFTPGSDDSRNLLTGRERNTFERLTRIGRSGAPYSSLSEELLRSIRSRRLDADTQLYHLQVSGDGTYFTEGVKFRNKA